MNEYKIEFSYPLATGKHQFEDDTSMAFTTQEAVDRVREWYGDLVNFRIERVWVARGNRWEITEAWD